VNVNPELNSLGFFVYRVFNILAKR